jgi:hypothetical protein
MNLKEIIINSEKRNLSLLEEFFFKTWGDTKLWSHDLSHHRRVWNFSKELLITINHHNTKKLQEFCDKLIIACFLHDIGMSFDLGIFHGRQSKKLCQKFLNNNNFIIDDFSDVLSAVENHDNKNYENITRDNLLLTILSVADDLDAFGYTGISRYLEIYLKRGVDLANLGNLISENASGRFENFSKTFGYSAELFKRHKIRYKVLEDFSVQYNKNVSDYKFGRPYPAGYCGVAEIFLEILTSKKELKDYLKNTCEYSNDNIIKNFFCQLGNELHCYKNNSKSDIVF